MKISIKKHYQTKSGLPVRIYATDGYHSSKGDNTVVHGAVLISDKGWIFMQWNHKGGPMNQPYYICKNSSELILIEI